MKSITTVKAWMFGGAVAVLVVLVGLVWRGQVEKPIDDVETTVADHETRLTRLEAIPSTESVPRGELGEIVKRIEGRLNGFERTLENQGEIQAQTLQVMERIADRLDAPDTRERRRDREAAR